MVQIGQNGIVALEYNDVLGIRFRVSLRLWQTVESHPSARQLVRHSMRDRIEAGKER